MRSNIPLLYSVILCYSLAILPTAVAANESGEEIFKEDFELNGNGKGSSAWFSFGGGTEFESSTRVDEIAGYEASAALIFQMRGSDIGASGSYWYAGLGRLRIAEPQGVSPDRLIFKAWAKVPMETNPKTITFRFLQGTPEDPTWTSSQIVDVGSGGDFVELNLGEGEVTGEFSESEPVHLHAILFGHGAFGFNRPVEFVIDEVSVSVRSSQQ